YSNLTAGYKMVGNAVPPYLGYYLAKSIIEALGQTTQISPSYSIDNTNIQSYNSYQKLSNNNLFTQI
ncbi:MAG: hypothetical protein WHU93_02615, partial [Arcobacteraceae bacterium]